MPQNTLVSTAWLADNLTNPDLRIVDIRGHVLPASEPLPHYFNHQADYDQSHLPNAVFVDWVKEITNPADPRHAKIAPPERFAAVMQRIGVSDSTLVVAYDDAQGMFAARLWWALNYYGHDKVAVLDGGWQKWIAEGRPVSAAVPQLTPSAFVARPNPHIFASGQQVEASINSATKLIDVRSPQEFAGEYARAPRKGHIPSAVNVPRTALFNPDGTMLTPEALRQRFAAVGVDETTPQAICYCNGGVSASFGVLALTVAGFGNAANYDGSWKEWGNDDSKPIV